MGPARGNTGDFTATTPPEASGAGQPVVRGTATAIGIAEPDAGQSQMLVSLAVPADSATAVSAAGAAGRLSLVVKAP